MQAELLEFAGYPGPVRASLDASLRPSVASLLKGWSISPASDSSAVPQLEILADEAHRLTVRGPWVGPDYSLADPVDAACAFIAEVLKVQANESSDSLCVHAAGVVLGGRAVLFPAGFRAGKSILTAVLASRGERIIADDATLISPDAGVAVGPGISPRLRLPVPDTLRAVTRAFIDTRMELAGRRYGYLTLPDGRLLANGERVPIGAFVQIERQAEGGATLAELPKEQALKALIWQNFARRIPAGRILAALSGLVRSRPTLVLRYADVETAADLLQGHFADWPAEMGSFATLDPWQEDAIAVADGRRWRRGPSLVEKQFEGGHFIADEENGRIFHLNATAAVIWHLLSAGDETSDVAALLLDAFPETDALRIADDVGVLAQSFREKGLLVPA